MTRARRLAALVFGVAVLAGAGAARADEAKAIFAGGCFWCMEPPFDNVPGVISTTSGYSGGHTQNPSYQEVGAGGTGHAEAVEIVYDPKKVTYAELLTVFWRNVDPTDAEGQFCDKGDQYRSEIFYGSDEEKRLAEQSKTDVAAKLKVRGPIVTKIELAVPFYRAEDYHQDYYEKNPLRYRYYRRRCGRDARLAEVWGSDRS